MAPKASTPSEAGSGTDTGIVYPGLDTPVAELPDAPPVTSVNHAKLPSPLCVNPMVPVEDNAP